ncbi:MAG TPA: L-rhamnose isomerase [Actinomycetota bacterium]|nr:L-rhamnose isomerase [Actinomycetota bacterium]
MSWALGKLQAQHIEVPSWGFGDSGTRFKVFQQAGAPRTPFEKIDDAALLQSLVGCAKSIALHIPWDTVDDFKALRKYAEDRSIKLGAINPNLFQDDEYKLGSICHPDEAVRNKSIDHLLECVEIAKQVDSGLLSLWFADGTNYPGQDNLRDRKRRLEAALRRVYDAMPEGMRMLVEYKLYEPAFYSTDFPDWGLSYLVCNKLGPQAQVLVDLGHHAHGVNIEQIVAMLLTEGRLGGFHFNDRKYGDDDLMVGSVNPYQLFLIYCELAAAEDDEDDAVAQECARNVAYMIDQAHNIELRIPALIRSIMNLQEAYAKAILVDRAALKKAQENQDVLAGHQALLDAYSTDVRPLLAETRVEMGLGRDPMEAYVQSGYQQKIENERPAGSGMGWS